VKGLGTSHLGPRPLWLRWFVCAKLSTRYYTGASSDSHFLNFLIASYVLLRLSTFNISSYRPKQTLYTHAIFKFDRLDLDCGIAKLGREVYQAIHFVKLNKRDVNLIADLHSIYPELRKSTLKGWVV
jgi:hypothetical protein